MSTYRQIYYHIVFGTKNRKRTIPNDYSEELYRYISGVIKNKKCELYRINGVEDHIHILSDLHPSIRLSDYLQAIKVSSSTWMKQNPHFPRFQGWQEGYGAFTCSVRNRDIIIDYIKNQNAHHKAESFYDEYTRLLNENEIEFEERYLL